ncbi:MAG: methionyl-tRNA formyltransferase [Dehalococcoidia bacterium]|nr:methionyl-tRNA formyltransferase [Dehalococcoidia bacterium]
MRVVFFGSPAYAVPSLRALLAMPDVEVVAVVTQPDRPRGRSGQAAMTAVKEAALEAGVAPLLQPERVRRDTTDALVALRPDVGVVAASGHILPAHLLEAFPHDVLNVHASLLPRYRGASPVAAAILAGDAESGATIMRVVREVDAGPIVGQARTNIEQLDTTATLTARIADLGAVRLAELLPAWVAGDIEAAPQDEPLVTYAPLLTKQDGVLDWTRPADELWRRVRAFQPWPQATTRYHDQPFTILEAWPVALAVEAAPGTVLAGSGDDLTPLLPGRRSRAVVACGRGGLALLTVQRPGKKPTHIEAYLNGDLSLIGARLG